MSRLQITIAGWDYDRIRLLKDNSEAVEGCTSSYITLPPQETFFRLFRFQEFDVAEASFGSYMLARTLFDFPYVLLPIPISRVFSHSAIFIRTDRGIRRPQDLKGKRIGVPSFQQSRGHCVRGMLQDEYGVAPSDPLWVVAGLDTPEHLEHVPDQAPKGARVEVAPGHTLSAMLANGELDALITASTPSVWRHKAAHVARLFPDFRASEQAYYAKTGIFPVMHFIAVRRRLVEAHPWLPRALMKAFEQAKLAAMPFLTEIGALATTLPWLTAEAEDTMRAMGEEFWPYGLEANRTTIEAQLRWCREQSLTRRRWTAEEIFHPATLEWYHAVGTPPSPPQARPPRRTPSKAARGRARRP